MRRTSAVAPLFICLVLLAGCASTELSNRDTYDGPKVARPDRIIVYDFAVSAADLPPWCDIAGRYDGSPTTPTPEALATGRQLGASIAKELVARIRKMGLNAVGAGGQPAARVGDIVITGYFESVDEGSATKRVVLGFGSGNADVQTQVEGYLATAEGMRKLGGGSVDASGGKTPGIAVPLLVTIATANPIGLVVGGAVKANSEIKGSSKIEGTGKNTAETIAETLEEAFKKQGWI